ncbi:TNF receptor-associated factor 6 [Agrilus planipennis]|uniref:TNF receptor-associated factor 6 n=1 Tax=Agrilus planipennis TaxID=224129 RepID=A0A1W4W6B8_AGRPL|nr:TNF receptor-associated factor 6 [Agrilus planipennis]
MATYNSQNFDQPEENCLVEDDTQVPEARFECPICLTWLRDPVLTSCGHRFCRKCIYSWLEKDTDCPVDKTKLNKDTDIFPDNFTRREISQQKTKCPNVVRGCLKELSPLDIEYHLQICKYRIPELPDNEKLRCNFVAVGCIEKFENEVEVKEHLEKNIHNHLNLLSQAYSKFIIDQSTSSNALAQQANFWDPPAKIGSNGLVDEHVNSSNESLIKSLYEKIIILEQKTREQDIIIANMSEQISSCNLLISTVPTKFCFGSFLWPVADFKTKITRMSNNSHMMCYSPGFQTSPFGYKLCIRLNLSPKNPNYLAIFIHMMKTDHDNSLDWPFNGKISITVVHPVNLEQNIKETMMTRPELEAFKKPKQELNPRGFGYTEFALIQDLCSEGFVDKDQLLIKVHVQPV